MSKRIAILGSTGSIGVSALEVVEHLGPPFRAVALSGHRQTEKLLEQARRHRPAAVALPDSCQDAALERSLREMGIDIHRGNAGLVEIVRRPDVDVVLVAIVGAAGLGPVMAAVEAGKQLALANKESLAVAGSLLVPLARKRNVNILPVDSEHSAIYQAMACGRRNEVRRVILTASGGPFRTSSRGQMQNATLADALNHPTWRMGNKISIDSATMFNKALEILEACWLFDLSAEQVEVVVHPQSIVHSMVEFIDGSVIAQLSPPDMKTPIQYALTYPARRPGSARRLDLARAFDLHFEPPDLERFPAIALAFDAVRAGGAMGAVLNAANERAVEAFVAGDIPFGEISRLVALTMASHQPVAAPDLAALLAADRWAREFVSLQVESAKPVQRA